MLSEELEITLGAAVTLARKERHEIITVEHLLFALLDDRNTRKTLVSCGGDEAWSRLYIWHEHLGGVGFLGDPKRRGKRLCRESRSGQMRTTKM